MPSTAEQVKSIVLKYNGRARKQQIARELNLSLDYAGLICRELERKGKIIFSAGFYSLTKSDYEPQSKSASLRGKQKKFIQHADTKSVLLGIPKMTKSLIDILERAGYKTIESLSDAPIARLMQETNLKLHEAAGLINQARKALNKI